MEGPSKTKMIEMYTYLLRARRNEERYIEMTASGVSPTWIHSELGQESVGVGVALATSPQDYLTYNHRGRSILEPRGVDLRRFMAQFLCRKDGLLGGKLGEFFVNDFEHGVVQSTCLIGDSIPFATGLALSCQYKGTDQVTVALFGDGCVDSGLFHESLNVAALWKLPVVYICCNNGWAEFTPQELTASITDVYKKAAGYGMPGLKVDGTDVLAVHKAASKFITAAREGKGPSLLECKCNRWEGHFYGDPQRYRDPKDIEEARKNDPLAKLQEKLLKQGILTEKLIDEIEQKSKADLAEAVAFAENSPPPAAEAVTEHVYYEGD